MSTHDREQRVYVIDDDEAVRDSMGMLLESADLPYRCFSSADSFIAEHDGSERGCLVLDIRMPGMTGLELQQQLAQIGSSLPISPPTCLIVVFPAQIVSSPNTTAASAVAWCSIFACPA